jgi:hypothetical protein
MNKKSILAVVALALACAAIVAVSAASASGAGGRPELAAGPASGFVPANAHAAHPGGGGHVSNLIWGGGPVQHSTTTIPIFWGTSWGNSGFVGDKVTGLDYLYSHVGGTSYLHTNSEYTDGSGNVNTTSVSKGSDLTDLSATPSGAPSTTAVLNEVAKETGGSPQAGAYYPVYSDQPRGNAGYCAWHTAGTINGIEVQFGFFFNLDGDPGCDPGSPSSTGHSQGLAALGNVTGHELSEMLTDPQINAWQDRQGNENADKCAWTFDGLVTIGSQSWKIQGNWSNAAANARTGYANVGCIQTS